MKIGAENRTKVIFAAVLAGIAVISMGRWLWPTSSSAPAVSRPPAAAPVAPNVPRPVARRSSTGRPIKPSEPRLDPTLDLDLLRQSEQIKYAGSARNIFVAGSPIPVDDGTTDHRKKHETAAPTGPPPIPPPPPINLKFYGFASKPGEPKKVFLSQGDDIFVASEGDIVNRRYRVVHIAPTSVDIEDVLYNNRQSIPLTQS